MIYTILGILIGIFVILWLLIQLVKTQNKLNFMTLRYSELKKSIREEVEAEREKAISDNNIIVDMLLSYAKNKPVLLLEAKGITKVKRNFDIKKTGEGTCRIKSNKAGGKRVTTSGILALENKLNNTFIPISLLEYSSTSYTSISNLINKIKKGTITNAVDMSSED